MFPSVLNTFARPDANDRLNSPSHSALHNAVSSALGQVQAVIGAEGPSSVAGSFQYLVKSPASDGGGHVQTAAKGGTGQTSYAKGDVLVAQSSSVLAKLNAGSQGQVIVADNSTATGIRWGGPVKLGQNASIITLVTAGETSLMSVSIPSSVLSTSNTVRATLWVSAYTVGNAADTLMLRANYGANSLGSVLLASSATSSASVKGKIEYVLHANNSASLQRGQVLVRLGADRLNVAQSSFLGIDAFRTGTSSINSASAANMGMTGQWATANAGTRLDIDGYLVEIIS